MQSLNLISHRNDANFLAKALTTTDGMILPRSSEAYYINREGADEYIRNRNITDPDSQDIVRDLGVLLQPLNRDSGWKSAIARYRDIATQFWQTAVAAPHALATRTGTGLV